MNNYIVHACCKSNIDLNKLTFAFCNGGKHLKVLKKILKFAKLIYKMYSSIISRWWNVINIFNRSATFIRDIMLLTNLFIIYKRLIVNHYPSKEHGTHLRNSENNTLITFPLSFIDNYISLHKNYTLNRTWRQPQNDFFTRDGIVWQRPTNSFSGCELLTGQFGILCKSQETLYII